MQSMQQHLLGSLFGMYQQAIDAVKDTLTSTNEVVRFKAAMWVIDKCREVRPGPTDAVKVIEDACQVNLGVGPLKDREKFSQMMEEEGLV